MHPPAAGCKQSGGLRGATNATTETLPHPAVDGEEIRAIAGYSKWIPQDPQSWVGRVSDVELYTMPRVKANIEAMGFKLFTWRTVRDAIRKHYF